MPSPGRAVALAGSVAAGLVVVDQIVKAIVRDEIAVGERVHVAGPFDLVHVRNTGVAFSALREAGGAIFVLVAAAVALLLWYFWRHRRQRLLWLPVGLVLGGALGNVIDRIRLGAVTDFLSFWSFPAFNVADMAISVGVVALALLVETGERQGRDPVPASAPPTES